MDFSINRNIIIISCRKAGLRIMIVVRKYKIPIPFWILCEFLVCHDRRGTVRDQTEAPMASSLSVRGERHSIAFMEESGRQTARSVIAGDQDASILL